MRPFLHHRRLVAALIVAAALTAGCAAESELEVVPQEGPPGSLVMVTIDTLRADRLSLYGYFRRTSPFLDRFASQALVFDRFYTTMSTTLPAHFSLFSSLHPLQTGIVANAKRLNIESGASVRLLAEMLADAGYTTAAFVSATPVKKRTGLGAGFQHYAQPEKGQRRADATTDLVLEWLQTAPDEPFFLWIHYFDPHWPYEPAPPFDQAFVADEELVADLSAKAFPDPRNEEVLEVQDLYDGEILFVDGQLERLTAALSRRPSWETTTLLIAADHGEGLGQHDWMDHGRLYDEQLRIPLIIRFPEDVGVAGKRFSGLGSIVDLVPTLAETLNLPLKAEDREQFVGLNILSPERRREFVFAQRTVARRDWGPGEKFAIIGERWKYAYATEGEDEFFDLESDPYETENGLRRHGRRAASWRDKLLQEMAELTSRQGVEVLEERSPQTLEELRALGYLE